MTNREAAIKIIKQLHEAGYQALLAGGCVRDMLLNRSAKDYDVATNARPEEVTKLFKRTIEVGAKFGVVMVMMGQQQVEVATFRSECNYSDGRHPDKVEFCDAKTDASRRDFTVNGMFYDPVERKVIDYTNGQQDLANGILRTIGDANERFGEDYLRLLRAVRFSVELGFEIEKNTWDAVCGNSAKITNISGERIAMEFEAILSHPNRVKGVRLLCESGLSKAVFGGVSTEQADFGMDVLGELPKEIDFALALAGYFAGCQTESVMNQVEVLKLSKAQSRHLQFLLDKRGWLLDMEMPLAELKLLLGTPYFWDLYELQHAIQDARGQSVAALTSIRKRAGELKGVNLRPKPLLDGHELIELGVCPGPTVGHVAQEMYIAQLSEEIHTADQARAWVTDWLARHRELN